MNSGGQDRVRHFAVIWNTERAEAMIFFRHLKGITCSWAVVLSLLATGAWAGSTAAERRAVPRIQVVPMPYDRASFQRDGVEIARYHFGAGLNRPFIFPVIGPSGRPLTRMGHPHDPESHSHHNSVWISHHDVGGTDFWGDKGGGKIRHKRVLKYEDGGEWSFLAAENEWVDSSGKILLQERRQMTVLLLEGREWLLIIEMELKAKDAAVELGKSPFGMIGVRVAKTMGVNDGGGRIRNSEGKINEKEIFWKRAKWVDYSGPVAEGTTEGVTLFDHPGNPNFPSHFHVRNDGWMGASLTLDGPLTIEPGRPVRLRYGLYVHSGMKPLEVIEARWEQFGRIDPAKPGRTSTAK